LNSVADNPAVTDFGPRCSGSLRDGRNCNKLLGLLFTRPWAMECPKCGTQNGHPLTSDKVITKTND